MKRILAIMIFRLIGWKVIGLSVFPKRCLVICAPHTSNWDFFFAKCYGYILGISPGYLAKSELFLPILGKILKWNGAIPIYRSSSNNMVTQIVEMYNQRNNLIIGLSPEGTRSRVDRWKTGFYHIAHQADIPILFLKIDYKYKEIGVFNQLIPTGNYKKDILFIEKEFASVHAKKPHCYNPVIK